MPTITHSLPANYKSMSAGELMGVKRKLKGTGALTAFGKPTMMAQELDRAIRAAQAKPAASTPAPAATAAPAASKAGVSESFQKALAEFGDTGTAEKLYQQGKRRTLSDIAMQSVQAGMANTLNMPAAGIAYDEANRPAFALGQAQQRAGILQNQAGTLAGLYSTDVGAATSRYGIDVGAQTAQSGQAMDLALGQQQLAQRAQLAAQENALSRYLGELRAKYSQPSGGGGVTVNFGGGMQKITG